MPRLLAIAPPAPVLLNLGDGMPPDAAGVLAACDRAVGQCVAGEPEVTVVAAPDRPRDLAWRPTAVTSNRPGTGSLHGVGGPAAVAPLGWLVADCLLDRAGFQGVRRRIAVAPETALPPGNLLVMADGSAARGDRSPRMGAPGEAFDTNLEQAVRTCSAQGLAAVDDTAAARVGCTGAAAWRALAAPAATAECAWLDVMHPWGVTYLVGVWLLAGS